MHQYLAYGLTFESELAFPELVEVAPPLRAPDVSIRIAAASRRPPPDHPSGIAYHVSAAEIAIAWDNLGHLAVHDGSLITIEPSRGANEGLLRLYILGAAMAILLQQRGRLVLHGSAVEIAGGAAAFLGNCGAGKSTTAAALYHAGHPLVSDDILSLTIAPAGLSSIHRAYPSLRLCPDATRAFGLDATAMPLSHPDEDKRLRFARDGFVPDGPLPLRRIYVLADGDALRIEPLAIQPAFLALLQNSFTARLLRRTGDAPAHLHQCTSLTASGLVHRLTRPRNFATLPHLVALIENDFGSLTPIDLPGQLAEHLHA
jgi:hypothetical protein